MRNVESKLKERMEGYYYGQMNLLKENFNFVFHFGDFFSIRNFYGGQGRIGVCNNQVEVYHRLNKDLNLIKVGGSEPTYFNSSRKNHFYLMYPTKPLPSYFWELPEVEKIELLKKSNSLVVDPSLKEVIPFESSDYFPNKVYLGSIFSDSWLTSDGSTIFPLGISREDELVSLGTYNNKMGLFFKRKYDLGNYLALPLGSKELDSKLKEERFLRPLAKKLDENYLEHMGIKN